MYSAQASSNPVATPGARIQPNVPDQDTPDSGPATWLMKPRSEAAQASPHTAPTKSRDTSGAFRLAALFGRTVRAGPLLPTLNCPVVLLGPGDGPAHGSPGEHPATDRQPSGHIRPEDGWEQDHEHVAARS
jgi:hypothetical protein